MFRFFYRVRRRVEKSMDWLRGAAAAWLLLPLYRLFHHPIRNLNFFERRISFIERREYAQNQEDGIINAIFTKIRTTNRFYVEFGVEDGIECNTRYLRKHRGWSGLLMDGGCEDSSINLHREFITVENIEALFRKYKVPQNFDLLSIDIDGNDYWVWKAISSFTPRVVIIEYNACIPFSPAVTIPYQSNFQWDKTAYYGASLSALVSLGKEKGYSLVGTDGCGINAFFVLDELIRENFDLPVPEKLYHPAAFKGKKGNAHPPDLLGRAWVAVNVSNAAKTE